MDAVMYDTEAEFTVDTVRVSANAPGGGVFVLNQRAVPTEDVAGRDSSVEAFPNPADEQVTLSWSGDEAAGTVEVLSGTGQLLRTVALAPGQRRLVVETADLPAGLYTLHVTRGARESNLRVVVR